MKRIQRIEIQIEIRIGIGFGIDIEIEIGIGIGIEIEIEIGIEIEFKRNQTQIPFNFYSNSCSLVVYSHMLPTRSPSPHFSNDRWSLKRAKRMVTPFGFSSATSADLA